MSALSYLNSSLPDIQVLLRCDTLSALSSIPDRIQEFRETRIPCIIYSTSTDLNLDEKQTSQTEILRFVTLAIPSNMYVALGTVLIGHMRVSFQMLSLGNIPDNKIYVCIKHTDVIEEMLMLGLDHGEYGLVIDPRFGFCVQIMRLRWNV